MIGGTKNEQVFQLWKKGVRAMLLPYNEADINEAEECFKDAIELEAEQQTGKPTSFNEARANDLGYPRAWSRYGYVQMTRFIEGWRGQEILNEADEFRGHLLCEFIPVKIIRVQHSACRPGQRVGSKFGV